MRAAPSDPLTKELSRRARAGELSPGQWRHLLERVQRQRPDLLALDDRAVVTRQTWRRDTEVLVYFVPSFPFAVELQGVPAGDLVYRIHVAGSDNPGVIHGWGTRRGHTPDPLGPPPEGETGAIDIELFMVKGGVSSVAELEGLDPVISWSSGQTFDIVDAAEQVMQPCEGGEIDEGAGVGLYFNKDSWSLHLLVPETALVIPELCSFGARIAIWRDDVLVATGDEEFRTRRQPQSAESISYVRLKWTHRPVPLDIDAASWRAVLTGDPRLAMRELRSRRYWVGPAEFPVVSTELPWESRFFTLP